LGSHHLRRYCSAKCRIAASNARARGEPRGKRINVTLVEEDALRRQALLDIEKDLPPHNV
jgi:hypothetical protein